MRLLSHDTTWKSEPRISRHVLYLGRVHLDADDKLPGAVWLAPLPPILRTHSPKLWSVIFSEAFDSVAALSA
jgi:hypothetical protein